MKWHLATVMAVAVALLGLGAAGAQEAAPWLRPVGEWRPERSDASVRRVARGGTSAYAIDATSLQVIDVADPARPVARGRLELGSDPVAAIAASGSSVLVFQHPTLRVIDAADPAQPRQIGAYTPPVGDCGGWRVDAAIAIDDARVYLALGPIVPEARCVGHLSVLDLTDPAAPRELGTMAGIGPVGAARVVASTLYLAESGQSIHRFARLFARLRVFDVADPAHPRELGSVESSMTLLWGLGVVGQHAYLAGGGTCAGGFSCHYGAALEVVDVADPARPTRAASLRTGYVQDLETAGRFLFLAEARRVAYSDGYVGCLRVFDAVDPVRPVQVAATEAVQSDLDLALDASHAYVADGDAMRVFGWVGPAPTPAPIPTPAGYRVFLPYVADAVGCDPG